MRFSQFYLNENVNAKLPVCFGKGASSEKAISRYASDYFYNYIIVSNDNEDKTLKYAQEQHKKLAGNGGNFIDNLDEVVKGEEQLIFKKAKLSPEDIKDVEETLKKNPKAKLYSYRRKFTIDSGD